MKNALIQREERSLVETEPEQPEAVAPLPADPRTPGYDDILSSPAAFRHAMELASTLSRSQLLPAAFRGRPEDVFMAILLARKMGEDVFTILSNVHFVSGKPGWSAPFLIARANGSGVFEGELSFETTGEQDDLAVTCSAVLKKSGKRVSKTVSLHMARADGWTRNAKYSSIPEQMLSYRAATFLIRLYCPAILFGLHTADEWEDVAASRRVISVGEDKRREMAVSALPRGDEGGDPKAIWLDRTRTLHTSRPDLVSAAAKRLGLQSAKQCSASQLRQLCEDVEAALAHER